MGKSKTPDLDFLKEENRKLKSIIRNLKKEVARYNKRQHLDNEETLAEEMVKDYKKDQKSLSQDLCTNCGNDRVEVIELGVKNLYICSSCGQRVLKKR